LLGFEDYRLRLVGVLSFPDVGRMATPMRERCPAPQRQFHVSLNGKKSGMDYTFRQKEVHDRAIWPPLRAELWPDESVETHHKRTQ